MTWLITAVGLGLLLVSPMFAGEHSAFARVTVYWHSEGSGANAAWNGVRLRDGHCAVDPKKIPYGSQVVFDDADCVAVDTGPDVVNRKAARSCVRSAAERNAIVIDRSFDTKKNALTIPTCHHMEKTPAIFDPDRSCHSSLFKYMPRVCQDLLTDPYSFPHFGKVPIKAS